MTHQPRARLRAGAVSLALAALPAALAGCGGGAPAGADVTVTVTPTVTATSAAKPKPKPQPAQATSDVRGRAFDFGVVTKVGTVGDTTVLELDRWTWKGLDDEKLAREGVPTAPFKGAVPYENQNAELTYSIPLADGARILQHHCTAADQPLQTKSVDAQALMGLADRENAVRVELDDQGRAVAVDNIPGCPG